MNNNENQNNNEQINNTMVETKINSSEDLNINEQNTNVLKKMILYIKNTANQTKTNKKESVNRIIGAATITIILGTIGFDLCQDYSSPFVYILCLGAFVVYLVEFKKLFNFFEIVGKIAKIFYIICVIVFIICALILLIGIRTGKIS